MATFHRQSAAQLITQLRVICCALLVALPSHARTVPAAPEEDIRGPRGPIEIPSNPAADYRAWWFAVGALALLTIAYFAWKWWKNAHTPATAEKIALQALKNVTFDRPDETFANEVSAILRSYVQSRYSIAATQRSTEEFLAELTSDSTLGRHQSKLHDFLRSCDRAKFANCPLSPETRKDLVDQATTFVVKTSQPTPTTT